MEATGVGCRKTDRCRCRRAAVRPGLESTPGTWHLEGYYDLNGDRSQPQTLAGSVQG